MLAVLRGQRRRLALIAVLALAVVLTPAPPRAAADYQTVGGGLVQWPWVLAASPAPMTAAVVRPDGWLIVATSERFSVDRMVGGGLLLVPPWGGPAIPFGDPPSYETFNYGYTSLVLRGERLFGLTPVPEGRSRIGQKARLVELDARTGAIVATHGSWWFPELTTDPRTGDLVLWDFRCTGRCGADDVDGDELGIVTHRLVRYNPDTRRAAVLLPDPKSANIGGSGTCQERRDSWHACEEIFRVAFSADGGTLFLGTSRATGNVVDVRDRNGTFRYSIPVPRPVDALRVGAPDTCLAGGLVITSFDGTAWIVLDAATDTGGGASRARLMAGGGPIGASAAALTPEGDVLTLRRTEGVLLACPPWSPPLPPGPPVVAAAPPAPAEVAPAPASAGTPPPSPSAPPSAAPPAPANVAPPVQPPGVPAVAGPAAHAPQAVTSLNVGLADAEQEQPVYSLSASRRTPDALAWGSLAVGTAAAVGFASVAFVTIPFRRREPLPRLATTPERTRC